MLVSQPFAALPSQLPNPALHAATPHEPAEHAAVPFAAEHTVPHAPQLLTLVSRLVSQPSAEFWLQSACDALHVPPPPVHAPFVQDWPVLHAWPQAPQLLTSVSEFTSHPFSALPSQSMKPALHAPMAH